MTEEYVSGELREKVIAIICEESPEPGRHLKSATIYERLRDEGIEVPERAMSEILLHLANENQIKLTVEPGDLEDAARDYVEHGRITIHDVIRREGLCP
jgi:hypothetical protein